MTDSIDDDDKRRSEFTGDAGIDSQVPTDTDWELAVQVPFDEDEDDELTSAIIRGVADVEGVSPMEVKEPPLYEVLDVAALDAAFFGSSIVGQRSNEFRSVEFMYRGHRIVIRSDGWIQIYGKTDA